MPGKSIARLILRWTLLTCVAIVAPATTTKPSCDAVEDKLIKLYHQHQPVDLARVLFYLERDSHSGGGGGCDLLYKLFAKGDSAFKSYADQLIEDTKTAKGNEAFEIAMWIILQEMLVPSDLLLIGHDGSNEKMAEIGYDGSVQKLLQIGHERSSSAPQNKVPKGSVPKDVHKTWGLVVHAWDKIPAKAQKDILSMADKIDPNEKHLAEWLAHKESSKKWGRSGTTTTTWWWFVKRTVDLSSALLGAVVGFVVGVIAGVITEQAGRFKAQIPIPIPEFVAIQSARPNPNPNTVPISGAFWGVVGFFVAPGISDYLTSAVLNLPRYETVAKAYEFFGVDWSAPDDEVNEAYRKISKKTYRDRNKFLKAQINQRVVKMHRGVQD